MPLTSLAPLSDSDKLEALRRHDQFREWRSLDDKRFCLVCCKIITGHQIRVTGGADGNGSLGLSCPTARCDSIPMDWVLLTDEILALAATAASNERNITSPEMTDHPLKHGLTWQLRKFATHFKRAS